MQSDLRYVMSPLTWRISPLSPGLQRVLLGRCKLPHLIHRHSILC
jgi:hypothetical protein